MRRGGRSGGTLENGRTRQNIERDGDKSSRGQKVICDVATTLQRIKGKKKNIARNVPNV